MTPVQQIQTDRGRFAVRRSGAGPTVVFLHGWPESSYCWEGVVNALGDGFDAVRPDLRGLGDSERGGEVAVYAKDQLARDVLGLLDTLGVNDFFLVGHDWGGAVAQEVAVLAPERVRRLSLMNIILINAGRRLLAGHQAVKAEWLWYQFFQRLEGLPESMIPGSEDPFLRVFLRTHDTNAPFSEEAIQEYVRCYSIPGTPAAGANYYRAMSRDSRRWMTLKDYRFPMPTLLLYGKYDPVVVPTYLEGYEQSFVDADLEWFQAAHFVQEELPEQVADRLARFFA